MSAYPIGIYLDMKDAEYRAIPAVSQSTLKAFVDCPRKFKLSPKREPTPNMIYGSLVDSLWLTGDVSRYAVQPSVYLTTGMRCPVCRSVTDSKKCAKCKCERIEEQVESTWSNNSATCREWASTQEAQGKEVVSSGMWATAQAAITRLNAVPEICEARQACDVQVAVVAEIEGVLCKGLIDLCPKGGLRGGLADLKTVASADPKEWARYVFNMRLHWQAAMYLDLWNRATGEDLQDFFHIVSEQEPPHEPSMMALSHDFIALGRDGYRRALRHYAECQEKDEWPGYPTNAVIAPEPWMLKQAA